MTPPGLGRVDASGPRTPRGAWRQGPASIPTRNARGRKPDPGVRARRSPRRPAHPPRPRCPAHERAPRRSRDPTRAGRPNESRLSSHCRRRQPRAPRRTTIHTTTTTTAPRPRLFADYSRTDYSAVRCPGRVTPRARAPWRRAPRRAARAAAKTFPFPFPFPARGRGWKPPFRSRVKRPRRKKGGGSRRRHDRRRDGRRVFGHGDEPAEEHKVRRKPRRAAIGAEVVVGRGGERGGEAKLPLRRRLCRRRQTKAEIVETAASSASSAPEP